MSSYLPKEGNQFKGGRVMIMAGLKSSYVDWSPKGVKVFQEYFPNLNEEKDIVKIDAGHWIHSEKPYDFMDEF